MNPQFFKKGTTRKTTKSSDSIVNSTSALFSLERQAVRTNRPFDFRL